jgi:rRNA small subunit pseudouridine methyltransferase Nep1
MTSEHRLSSLSTSRRRRHSGSIVNSSLLHALPSQASLLSAELVQRPKSTPIDDLSSISQMNHTRGDDLDVIHMEVENDLDKEGDDSTASNTTSSVSVSPVETRPPYTYPTIITSPDTQKPIGEVDRPTKPLPRKHSHVAAPMQQQQYANNPHMLPVQHHVPKNTVVANGQKRLFVILERACLEAYRVSSSKGRGSGGGKGGGEGDVKYALLNCDDHQGILAKTGRDIADARPDITHQVRPTFQ